MRATRINVQPEYNWDNNARERNLIGYFVSRQVEVELRDLEKLGQLLERAIDLGVNQVGDPRLDSSKRRDLEREALAKAVADARLNAEAVAKAAGAKLGTARTISANSGFRAAADADARQGDGEPEAGERAQTYQSGQMTFNGTVQVEYDLISGGTVRRCMTTCFGSHAPVHRRERLLAALDCAQRDAPSTRRSRSPRPSSRRNSRRRKSTVTPTDETRVLREGCSASPPIARCAD